MSSNLVRWGGISATVASVMYALTAILSLFAPQEVVFDSFADYLIEAIFVVALAGTLVAIAGLHALQRSRNGRLGAAGSLTAFVGYALLFVAAATTALAGREAFDAVFPLGVLAVLVGSVLLGAATLRAGATVVVRSSTDLRLPTLGGPRRGRQRGRGDRAGGRLGAGGIRAAVEGRRAGRRVREAT